MIPEAPGQLGNTLQQERRVPAAPHYRVSAGPPCQTPERKDRGGRGPQREVSHSGAGGGRGPGEQTSPTWLILPVLALNLP